MGPQEYFKGMRDYFNIENPQNFFDKYFLNKRVIKLDLDTFINWLEDNHGKMQDNVSLKDQIVEKFGEDACTFVVKLL